MNFHSTTNDPGSKFRIFILFFNHGNHLITKITVQTIAIAYAIIPKGVAEGPDFGDDRGCIVAHILYFYPANIFSIVASIFES